MKFLSRRIWFRILYDFSDSILISWFLRIRHRVSDSNLEISIRLLRPKPVAILFHYVIVYFEFVVAKHEKIVAHHFENLD